MTISRPRRLRIVLLAVCALALTACGGRMTSPGSGSPADEAQIREMVLGNSVTFNDPLFSGTHFYAADGTFKQVGFKNRQPRVCEGTWSVSGSYLIKSDVRCAWKEGANTKRGYPYGRSVALQGRRYGAYGIDWIADGSWWAGTWHKFDSGKGTVPEKGFPKEAEFKRFKKELGFELALTELPKGHSNWGAYYLELGKYRHAIEAYDELLLVEPGAYDAHNERGIAYYKLGEFRRALKDHNAAVRIDPKRHLAYASRGNDYKRLGDLKRAIANWERAIQIGGASEVKRWQEYLKAKGHYGVIDGHYRYGPDVRRGLEACAADPDCEAG